MKTPQEILIDFMERYARVPLVISRYTEGGLGARGIHNDKPTIGEIIPAGNQPCRIGRPMTLPGRLRKGLK